MGLDMYLYASQYVAGANFGRNAKTPPMQKLLKLLSLDKNDTKYSAESGAHAFIPVGYWHKANAIHGWFVKNCQKGVDDCRYSWVQREQLEVLLELCEEVLKDHSKAEELLPSQSGFFFGGTGYDQYYFDDLKLTVEMLTHILESETLKHSEFYYRSSW